VMSTGQVITQSHKCLGQRSSLTVSLAGGLNHAGSGLGKGAG